MTTLYAVPDTAPLSVKEVKTWSFNFTNDMNSYSSPPTVTSCGATLTNKLTGADATAALSTIQAASPSVSLKITGSSLTAGVDYLLVVTATYSNGDIAATELNVKVQA